MDATFLDDPKAAFQDDGNRIWCHELRHKYPTKISKIILFEHASKIIRREGKG